MLCLKKYTKLEASLTESIRRLFTVPSSSENNRVSAGLNIWYSCAIPGGLDKTRIIEINLIVRLNIGYEKRNYYFFLLRLIVIPNTKLSWE